MIYLTLQKTAKLSSSIIPFCIHTSSEWQLTLLSIFTSNVYCRGFLFVCFCILIKCLMVFHCWFDLQFQMTEMLDIFFMCLFPIYIYFHKVSVQCFSTFLNSFAVYFLLLICKSFLCIWTWGLCKACFAGIFFRSVACLSVPFTQHLPQSSGLQFQCLLPTSFSVDLLSVFYLWTSSRLHTLYPMFYSRNFLGLPLY